MMKKKTLLALSMLGSVCFSSYAQDKPFFEKVDFVGAMGTEDWSKPWANYRPDTVNYPAVTTEITADITTNTTWTADKVYHLSKFTYVKNGATLTIEPGTIIRGSKDAQNAAGALIITRGSKIYAVGTPDKPIVFTSNESPENRGVGDWAGVMLFGRGIQNVPTSVTNGYRETNFEVFPPSNLDIWYGGNDDNDSSGVLKYVRVEFGGWYAEVDKEINGLTFGAVGKRTQIDYVQSSFTNDDSYEFFGGTVNVKHAIAYCGVDDDFDTDAGYRGNLQFLVGQRHPLNWDFSGSSGAASRGFESDNNTNGTTVSGTDNPLPATAPVFSNVTLIGPIASGLGTSSLRTGNKFTQGSVTRTNSSLSVFNSIIMGYPTGYALNNTNKNNPVSAYSKAVQDSISVRNMVISNTPTKFGALTNVPDAAASFNIRTWWGTPAFENDSTILLAENVGLVNPFPFNTSVNPNSSTENGYGDFISSPDYRLKSGAALLTSAKFEHPKISNTVVTAIDEATLSTQQVVLFPNPAANQVEIALTKGFDNATVNIQNTLGATVATSQAVSGSAKFDVSNLTNGLYIVSASNGSQVISKTLLINR